MRWPWKTEKRSSVYTDEIVRAILSRASGTVKGNPASLAALEVAAGLWSRALSTARVEPADVVTQSITPRFLASVGRSLIRQGESLFAITVRSGRVILSPAATWDIVGESDPGSWRYRLDLAAPSGSKSQSFAARSVLHFKFGVDPDRPWHGRSPMDFAATSATAAAALEQRLAEELSGPVAHLLPIPSDGGDGGDDDPLASLKADIANAQGGTVMLETTSSAWGEGRAAAPLGDWRSRRIGADPPEALAKLRSDSALAVLAACGVPPALAVGNSDGTAQRESYRRFVATSIRPAALEIAAELSEKLERKITFTFDDLRADDLVGRARTVRLLVDAGLSVKDASEAALFMSRE